MSEPVTALGGATFAGLVQVTELGPQGMITLRGDLSAAPIRDAAQAAAGTDMPGQRDIAMTGERGIAWMSPDELLILVPYAQVDGTLAKIQEALQGTHHLAADVSDARALFALSDGAVREVLAKLTPADLAPGHFGPGELRRTHLAQAAAAIWMPSEGEARVICFRSVAQYMFDLLSTAAQPDSAVGLWNA